MAATKLHHGPLSSTSLCRLFDSNDDSTNAETIMRAKFDIIVPPVNGGALPTLIPDDPQVISCAIHKAAELSAFSDDLSIRVARALSREPTSWSNVPQELKDHTMSFLSRSDLRSSRLVDSKTNVSFFSSFGL
jgi:hypothetical protein